MRSHVPLKNAAIAAALTFLAVSVNVARADSLLFTNGGAGIFAVTTGPNVNTLQANNDGVTAPSSSDVAFGCSSGIDFTSTGPATFTGMVYFSDPTTKMTGGTCNGGTCFVNSTSSISNTTITGEVINDPSAVTAAVNEWNALTNTSTGWGSVTGTAADLSSGGKLCAGSGTGCTATATTTTTLTINGQSETAYVFNITSSGGHINGPVTIYGTGSALIILNYGGTQTLQSNQVFTLAGGAGEDQVLLNDYSTGGMQTSGGFSFTGALAVTEGTADLDGADISGRLYLDGSGTSSIQSNFSLDAPPDVPPASTPEPSTGLLIGSSLIGLALLARKRVRDATI